MNNAIQEAIESENWMEARRLIRKCKREKPRLH